MASGSTSSNVVGVHYRVGKKIGEGSFGVIFEGTNLLNQQQVAIKFEPRKSDAPQLRDEYRTYKILVGCRESLPPLSPRCRCAVSGPRRRSAMLFCFSECLCPRNNAAQDWCHCYRCHHRRSAAHHMIAFFVLVA
jgi:serine/threonine protein kinase